MKSIHESLESKKFPILFIALLIFFIGIHLFSNTKDALIVNLMVTLVVGVSAFTISRRDRLYRAILTFGGLFILLRWALNVYSLSFMGPLTVLLLAIYFGFIIKGIIHFLLASKKVDTNMILGTVSAYLMIGILFSFSFSILIEFNPEALTRDASTLEYHDILYYTMITFTTIGYGDISPVSPMAQVISYMSGAIGQMYMGIVTAIIVGKFLQRD